MIRVSYSTASAFHAQREASERSSQREASAFHAQREREQAKQASELSWTV